MRLGRNRFIDRRIERDDYSQSSSALSTVVDAIRTVAIRSGRAVRTARRTRIEACEPRLVFDGALVISEFLTSNSAVDGLRDQDGTLQDWIEIRNTTAAPVNLAGWRLTDDTNEPSRWVFPDQQLAAGGHLVIFASNKDRRTAGAELHTNFKLSNNADYLALIAPDGSISSEFAPSYPDQFANISYGRSADLLTTGFFTTPTPGAPNTTAPIADPTKRVVINEIMFHPSSENDQHEFIELVNRGTQTVNLNGWQLTAGVSYTFGNVTVAPNQFLVVAANLAAFRARYGNGPTAVGGWTGTLSNTGEEIELRDPAGVSIDSVEYFDDGNWGTRFEMTVGGEVGWEWESLADGGGRSLELRNWQQDNNNGQNWGPSNGANGTPGVQNSINSTNIAPLISDVEQSVIVPSSTDPVFITAEVSDEAATGLTVNLRWRTGTGIFATVAMADNGLSGDGAAGDGVYGGRIDAQLDGTIVEYYVEARDGSNLTRQWPAPGRKLNNSLAQEVNALYRVDNAYASAVNSWTAGSPPVFMLVMTAAEYTEMDNRGTNSDAKGHGTFIVVDGTGVSIRHGASVRRRGASSRSYDPFPVRLEIPHDNLWHEYSDFNLNSRYPELQLIGSAVLRDAGLQAAAGTQVQLRVNGVNGAFGNQAPRLGSYIWLEPYNNEFLDRHMPNDPNGNIYKKVRPLSNWAYRNGNVQQYVNDGWSKSTNASENDWSDLDNLFRVMQQTPAGATYYNTVSQVANVDQWVRWFAAMELLNSRETNLSNGADDDYQIFAGINDPRFILLPHDLDTILGMGDTGSSPTDPFFEAIAPDAESMASVLGKFFNDPTIRTKYFLAIKELVETTFSAARFGPLVDNVLGGYVSDTQRQAMKTYMAQRTAYALTILPPGLTPPAPPSDPVDPPVLPTSAVIINEVLAHNVTAAHGATFPDKIELFNTGATAVSLAGMSISDSPTNKTKYVFSAGTTIAPGAYLVLYADSAIVPGEHHLGFALDRTGDGVYLFDTVANAQALLDSIEFGQQIADFSIGRMGAQRQFTLTQPTFGAANVAQATGSADTLKINEWYTSADIRFEDDYLELYNPANQPVALAGLFLTDEAIGDRQQYKIPPLSYIPASGFATFLADGQSGGNHLPFQLSSDFDHLGLSARNGVLIDQVIYRPQTTDYSHGRNPNGASLYAFYRLPSPDVSNPVQAVPQTVALLPINATWKFNQAGAQPPDQGAFQWYRNEYIDTSWSSGAGVLAMESPLPAGAPQGQVLAINTPAPANQFIMTSYFRTTFNLTGNPATSVVQLTPLIDDGALIYINGRELEIGGQKVRINMPSGTVNYGTQASSSVEATFGAPITIPSDFLVSGQNRIAVEVHQQGVGSSDIVMGMKIDAVLPAPNDPLVPLYSIFDGLRITEIMYNPVGGAPYEYVELQNISGAPLNIGGVRLGGAVDFTFPTMTLAAGQYVVVAANPAAFAARYGTGITNVVGPFLGDLSNGGENVVLKLPVPYEAADLRFDYNDTWYPNTDGLGYALEIVNPLDRPGDWDQRESWRAGSTQFGTPGTGPGAASPLSVTSVPVTIAEGNTGTANMLFTVLLSQNAASELKVAYATVPGSATTPSDYTAASGTLTFAAGENAKIITVPVKGDVLAEANETFNLTLTNQSTGVVVVSTSVLGTITNDDPMPTLSVADVSVTETNAPGVNAIFTVTLSSLSGQDVTVRYATANATASAGSDYTAVLGTLTFASGTNSQTITVPILSDTVGELAETFLLNLSTANGATIADNQAVGSITDDDLGTHLAIADLTIVEADTGSKNAIFTVTLSDVLAQQVTVNYGTSAGTATAGADYTTTTGALTFAPGVVSQTITVPVIGDTVSEADETFAVTLSGNVNAAIGRPTATGTITNNDPNPLVSIGDATVVEGNTGTVDALVTVTLSTASGQTTTVGYSTGNSTAIAGADYNAQSGAVTFAPGTTSQVITIQVRGDVIDESDEIFNVNLTNPTGLTIGDGQGSVTITDDDLPQTISIVDLQISEGGTGTKQALVTVSLSQPNGQQVTVSYATTDGSATAGADYTTSSGNVTFAAGEQTKTITIDVRGDFLDEPDETLLVDLTSPIGATIEDSQATVTILDDDVPLAVNISDAQAVEGDTGTSAMVFVVSLTNPSDVQVSVSYATTDGTARAGNDYNIGSGNVTFAPGITEQRITVNARGDLSVESNETFTVNLANVVNTVIDRGQATGTILDDDTPRTVSIADLIVSEGNLGGTQALVIVSLDAPATRNVTVNYSTAPGSAQSPSDFFAQTGAITFNQGATSRVITINVVGDTTIEPDETFVVNLTSAVGGTISDNQAVVTIEDDDALPGVSVAGATVGEGNQGTADLVFTVTLSASTAKQVTVAYGTANSTATAGSDYEARSGTITFAAGETSKTITVPVLGDTVGEANERLFLNLSAPVNAVVNGGPGTGTIVDDDTLPAVTVTGVELTEGNAGSTSAIFTVNLSVATGQTVTLAYATADGTATAGSDYTAISGVLTFAPGATSQTITVPVLGDSAVEPAETFELNFSGVTNATLSSPQALATIQNDDTLFDHPWQNARNRLDVNDNGSVEALDVLIVINRLNSTNDPLPLPPQAPLLPPPYYDVDGNDNVTALDALIIINFLNSQSSLQAGNLIAQGLAEPQLAASEFHFAQATSPVSIDAALVSDESRLAVSRYGADEAYGMADAEVSLPSRSPRVDADEELESILAELVG